ncbi:hypothetical protein PQJ75_18210 [Rhodoplanes sp. TEM]|uniref:tyrosine--tRNA ligase n=1 Tax=Rhodoplanes tepidamans TaxID=200616 RepID=A0ABT5JE41_RHOTP|nr:MULTISPECIES: hypothetical protein [Rhodoplanes]MDC7787872.1 hypothetical protein [Rhodoplanes tepidamans]MDC7985669.1 hypothetical protein [Rhodoplanes sp. TEM]MDQ0357865.1 tyrosyl-tRNA synthetase [Rhodoplanes tepidamans]
MPAPRPLPPLVLRSDALLALAERGLVERCTDLAGLDARLRAGPVAAYAGFDPDDPVRLEHLVPLMALRRLARAGHRPIVLTGGGTARMASPAGGLQGCDGTVSAAPPEIAVLAGRVLGSAGGGPLLVDNADWLDRLGYAAFLRDVGRHVRIDRLLGLAGIRTRLTRGVPVSLLELNFVVVQAYDFLTLARDHGCVLQIGLAGQWETIAAGVAIGRRTGWPALWGLAAPGLGAAERPDAGTAGPEPGPGASLAERLRAACLRLPEAALGRALRLLSELPLPEVDRLAGLRGREAEEARAVLADAVATLCGGPVQPPAHPAGSGHGSTASSTSSALAVETSPGEVMASAP